MDIKIQKLKFENLELTLTNYNTIDNFSFCSYSTKNYSGKCTHNCIFFFLAWIFDAVRLFAKIKFRIRKFTNRGSTK